MRCRASASSATAGCRRSAATRIASTRSASRMRRRSSSSSTGRRGGPTRRFSKSTRSSPSSPRARFPSSPPMPLAAAHAAHVRRLPLRGVPALRRPRAGALRPLDARMDGPLPRPHPRGRRARAVSRAAGDRRRDVRCRAARLAPRARIHSAATSRTRGAASPRRRSTRRARCFDRAGDVRIVAAARRLPRRQRAVDRARRNARPALRRLRRCADGARRAGSVDAALGRARRDDAPARRGARAATANSTISIRASSTSSRRCARCACCTTRRGSRSAGTTPPFPSPSPGSTRSATGRTGSSSCASRSR